jgi:hypothetical protein
VRTIVTTSDAQIVDPATIPERAVLRVDTLLCRTTGGEPVLVLHLTGKAGWWWSPDQQAFIDKGEQA